MRAVARMAAWTASGVVALALAVVLTGCGGYSYNVRYRLTFAVETDSGIKSASSIINVYYYGSDTVGASGRTGYSSVTGVAPVIDLGPDGWLVAAMDENGDEFYRRKRTYNLSCKPPKPASLLLAAFGLHARELTKLGEGRRDLADDNYPAFIWFPKDRPYTVAQQLCPEEFPKLIAGDVKFKSISIELVPNAPLKTQLVIKAPWLDELREDQRKSYPGEVRYKPAGMPFFKGFLPHLHSQIEVPGSKQ